MMGRSVHFDKGSGRPACGQLYKFKPLKLTKDRTKVQCPRCHKSIKLMDEGGTKARLEANLKIHFTVDGHSLFCGHNYKTSRKIAIFDSKLTWNENQVTCKQCLNSMKGGWKLVNPEHPWLNAPVGFQTEKEIERRANFPRVKGSPSRPKRKKKHGFKVVKPPPKPGVK